MEYIPHTKEERITGYMSSVYGLMSLAAAITAVVAYYVSVTPRIYQPLFSSPWTLFGLFLVQILCVVGLTVLLPKLNFFFAFLLFIGYAGLLGLTLSVIFLSFQMSSIYLAFFISAGMFAAMAIYGYFTRTDLTSIGNILFMALFGLIIGLVVNLFLKSPMVDVFLSAVGVILFTGLTAYDSQRIKHIGRIMIAQGISSSKVAVVGALTLYLDFINLFLYMLQLIGRRRN